MLTYRLGAASYAGGKSMARYLFIYGTASALVFGELCARPRPVPNFRMLRGIYLRPEEVNAVIAAAAKVGRNGQRNQVWLRLRVEHGVRTMA